MKRVIGVACVLIVFCARHHFSLAGQPQELPLLQSDVSISDKQRSCVMAMCSDRVGNLWTANEDGGVWRMDPSAPAGNQWKHFTTKDGLGDDCAYAIDCDNLGRIWVGHLNHGVSVFNGQSWQNYDVIGGIDSPHSQSGPIGDHVFGITVCRTTGDVWMATSAGLTRYVDAKDRWINYTRSDGLPGDAASAMAFDSQGRIYVATQCDGVAMADAADDYHTWNQVNGPDHLLSEPDGNGLASNRVNDIFVASDGTVYAATPQGVCWSTDRGISWRFERGSDWAQKVNDSVAGPPAGFTGESHQPLLAEDYVTSIAEDPFGYLWLGYRTSGLQRMVRQGDSLENISASETGHRRVKALMPSLDGCRGMAGTYGVGILPLEHYLHEPAPSSLIKLPAGPTAQLPAGATAPTLLELTREIDILAKVPKVNKGPMAVALVDDWRTRGDWLGRYGKYWCVICGMDEAEYQWGSGPQPLEHDIDMGPHHRPNDSCRYYVGELYNSDPRTLELPSIYMSSRVMKGLTTWGKNRRQSELNDNSETYPANYEGPDLYTSVRVPDGQFILSLYFVNDDGHKGKNALRDYELVVKNLKDAAVSDFSGFDAQPVLAHSRVNDFWGGVYKRFFVQGPATYCVKMARHYSFVVKFSAIMLDQLDERPAPYFTTFEDRDKAHAQPVAAMAAETPATETQAAALLVDRMEVMSEWNPQWWAENHRRISALLARWYQSHLHGLSKEDQARRTSCLYQAGLYSQWETAQKSQGLRTARDIERALRWDGVTPDSNGHGFELVTKYLESNPATQPAR
jgi:hypothetical protein